MSVKKACGDLEHAFEEAGTKLDKITEQIDSTINSHSLGTATYVFFRGSYNFKFLFRRCQSVIFVEEP